MSYTGNQTGLQSNRFGTVSTPTGGEVGFSTCFDSGDSDRTEIVTTGVNAYSRAEYPGSSPADTKSRSFFGSRSNSLSNSCELVIGVSGEFNGAPQNGKIYLGNLSFGNSETGETVPNFVSPAYAIFTSIGGSL